MRLKRRVIYVDANARDDAAFGQMGEHAGDFAAVYQDVVRPSKITGDCRCVLDSFGGSDAKQ